jgi:PIN domain nuclease of toxin-antitoxin system
MRLLLDTHAWLWWVTDDERLSPAAKQAVADADNEVFVSAASAWEIATKRRLGKLDNLPRVAERYGELIAADGFQHLVVDHRHALRAGGYALEHRDPFDRMLAAQSELERMPLVTRDPAFALFGTRTLW